MDEERHSLIDRVVRRLSRASAVPGRAGVDWRFAAALIALIALGPLATIMGAGVLARSARGEAAAVQAQIAPRLAARRAARDARDGLRRLVQVPPAAVWIDRMAAALPADARIARIARGPDGAIELDVTTPDPDAARRALRRARDLAGFREVGQRRAGAVMLVTYRRPA